MWFVKVPNRGRRYTSRYGTPVATRGILRGLTGRATSRARAWASTTSAAASGGW